jgi:phosphate transport system protein
MFREIIKALRAKHITDELLTEFDQMLMHTAWMFEQAAAVLSRQKDGEEVRDSLYHCDKQVNELERGMRRKIIRHLTINPQSNLTGCLVFMSVSKDAERIGDYCKNVFEVGFWYKRQLQDERFYQPLEQVRQEVQSMFDLTRRAFDQDDDEVAKTVIDKARQISKTCEKLIHELLQTRDDLDTDEAAAYSLLSRHYKRVSAHLSNICTAVVSPVDMLDFHDEPTKPDPESETPSEPQE